MCQMQLLQNMLCPAAILVCSLCASVPAYLMVLLEIVQLLVRALCCRCLIPCCVLFLGQLSLILCILSCTHQVVEEVSVLVS